MSHLIDIFLQPSNVFADLKAKPTFMLPLLLVTLTTAAMMLSYFLQVDPEWYLDNTLRAAGNDVTAAEAAQAKKMMPGAQMMAYITSITTIVFAVVATAVYALYFTLAGKVTGTTTSFKQGLSLSAWANMPVLLGMVASLVGVLTMQPQTSLESLMLLNADPLLVQLPADSAWKSFATSFNLLSLWAVFLTALGWRTWGRTGWTQAIVVGALPTLIIYGGMALFALLK